MWFTAVVTTGRAVVERSESNTRTDQPFRATWQQCGGSAHGVHAGYGWEGWAEGVANRSLTLSDFTNMPGARGWDVRRAECLLSEAEYGRARGPRLGGTSP